MYTWILEQLLEANGEIVLIVIINNADTGLDAALKTFLPNVKHIRYSLYIY